MHVVVLLKWLKFSGELRNIAVTCGEASGIILATYGISCWFYFTEVFCFKWLNINAKVRYNWKTALILMRFLLKIIT